MRGPAPQQPRREDSYEEDNRTRTAYIPQEETGFRRNTQYSPSARQPNSQCQWMLLPRYDQEPLSGLVTHQVPRNPEIPPGPLMDIVETVQLVLVHMDSLPTTENTDESHYQRRGEQHRQRLFEDDNLLTNKKQRPTPLNEYSRTAQNYDDEDFQYFPSDENEEDLVEKETDKTTKRKFPAKKTATAKRRQHTRWSTE
ncbi:hypothetical protein OS493_019922 [Desmophyllum pertusum]|uniref:Uncharacterized protein n=1 Tax=Desmophyllum pertusum TaxID=174260 RepID=A0A9W9YPD4_9CNID|nr:hypothetical protein OS493_019922 [Desmophyllum pertusum]